MFSFKKITKSDWHHQIEQDIAPRTIHDLSPKIIEGISNLPFAHPEDLTFDISSKLPQRRDNSWLITYEINKKDFTDLNKCLLQALKYGAEAIHFVLRRIPDAQELNVMLSDVRLDWFESLWSFDGVIEDISLKNFEVDIIQMFPELQSEKCRIFNNNNKSIALNATFKIDIPNLSDGESSMEDWAKILKDIGVALERIDNSIKPIIFFIKGTNNILWNIIQIRSFKLLYLKLMECYTLPSKHPKIHFGVHPKMLGLDPHVNLIRSTSIGLSGIIGGIDYLDIPGNGRESIDSLWQMSAIHLQYILREEGKLGELDDPLKGSYYIESMTEELCRKVWHLFQQMHES
ncbi:MAG: methylmalonyl-CoA mutase family protein [Bacteroidota bacterium]|nr:methylmalonyl-CoA mutase family protein [Bacteroidota bacterium]